MLGKLHLICIENEYVTMSENQDGGEVALDS